MTDLVDQITAVLGQHVGSWIDNGNTEKCHCMCGYRPKRLGEFHGRHVAEAIAELFTEEIADHGYLHRWVSPYLPCNPVEGITIDGVPVNSGDPVDIDKLVDTGVLPEEFRGKGEPGDANGVYTVS